MTETASRKRTVRFDLKPRLTTVSSVESITPTYVRITVAGDDLAGFQSLDPEDHIKLAFPEPGADAPVLPVVGEKGIEYPEGAKRPTLRDYTPRRFNADTNELVIDFVLHGEGPASNWASQAVPGHKLGILGPRGSHVVEDVFDWYLLVGDDTVVPSIARRLEEAKPGTKVIAFVEVDSATDEQQIETAADVELTWVHRSGAPAGTTTVLEDAIRARFAEGIPAGEVFAWAGGEALSLRGIRRFLLNEAGLNREWTSFSGHWKRGVADHDHHEAIED